MGLDERVQRIIRAVAENDIRLARRAALEALEADTTQKNRAFVNRYKAILTSEGANMVELPQNLRGIMICEDVSMSFKEGRYFVTENCREIYGEIVRMAKVSKKLMEMQIPYRNAALLYGPPGTGKTMFGRYVAYRIGLPFCYFDFARVVDSYMGGTAKNISQAFAYASANPCVFMLDEVDVISADRAKPGSGGADREIGRVTVTLMQEMDRLANDVVLIAATNRLDLLDKAFISRCSLQREMAPFTRKESAAMVRQFLDDIGVDLPPGRIEEAIQGGGDQRGVMNRLVLAVAEKVLAETQ